MFPVGRKPALERGALFSLATHDLIHTKKVCLRPVDVHTFLFFTQEGPL